MKNNAQEEYFSAPFRPTNQASEEDRERRIRHFRKAWQEGTLDINAPRLAQSIIDFETEVEPILPEAPKPNQNGQ